MLTKELVETKFRGPYKVKQKLIWRWFKLGRRYEKKTIFLRFSLHARKWSSSGWPLTANRAYADDSLTPEETDVLVSLLPPEVIAECMATAMEARNTLPAFDSNFYSVPASQIRFQRLTNAGPSWPRIQRSNP